MAIVIDNIYTKGISGRVGNKLLYKHYGHKTVVSAFPKLSHLTPSALQLAQRKKFALAVLKTRQWLQNKAKKQFLLGLKHKWNSLSAYHAGIKYHMTQPTTPASQAQTTPEPNHNKGALQQPAVAKNTPTNTISPTINTAKKKPGGGSG